MGQDDAVARKLEIARKRLGRRDKNFDGEERNEKPSLIAYDERRCERALRDEPRANREFCDGKQLYHSSAR